VEACDGGRQPAVGHRQLAGHRENIQTIPLLSIELPEFPFGVLIILCRDAFGQAVATKRSKRDRDRCD